MVRSVKIKELDTDFFVFGCFLGADFYEKQRFLGTDFVETFVTLQ